LYNKAQKLSQLFFGVFSHLKFQVIEKLIGKQAFKGCSFPLEKAVPLEREVFVVVA
jgi:hypothetical protein